MATSLVSTGVQFPDATIQTTAAGGTPGATAQWSVVGQGFQNTYSEIAFTPSSLASGIIYSTNFNGVYETGAGAYRQFFAPFWSSFYSAWFCLAFINGGNNTNIGIMTSKDGLSWRVFVPSIYTATGNGITSPYINPYGNDQGSVLAVDDSNGRFFYMYSDGSNTYVAYSSITSTVSIQTSGWTVNQNIVAAQYPNTIRYCKMSTTAASGIVLTTVSSNNMRVYTCPAGGTTFTSRVNVAANGNGGPLNYYENGYICLPCRSSNTVIYNLSGDISTGWTSNTSIATSPENVATTTANGYLTYTSGGGLFWSTNGTTWTLQLVGASSSLFGVIYTGSVWVAWNNQATYVSSTGAVNSTWSMYSGGANNNRFIPITTYNQGQRVTAT
jgi:hypothetical protein